MPTRDRPLYAVLIDADNIPAKFAGAILKEVSDQQVDPEEYDRERAQRYARREGLY